MSKSHYLVGRSIAAANRIPGTGSRARDVAAAAGPEVKEVDGVTSKAATKIKEVVVAQVVER